MDLYFHPTSKLRIQSTEQYLLWISYGFRAEIQFTINRWWKWPKIRFGKGRWEWFLFSYMNINEC